MPGRRAAWILIPTSSWSSAICAAIRSVWRAVTHPLTRIATHERRLELAHAVPARGVPRHQSRDGLAVRRRFGDAGKKLESRGPFSRAHHPGPRVGNWRSDWSGRTATNRTAAQLPEDRRRGRASGARHLPAGEKPPFPLGWHAGRVRGAHPLVFSDGLRTRRGFHGAAGCARTTVVEHDCRAPCAYGRVARSAHWFGGHTGPHAWVSHIHGVDRAGRL